ncbi:DUF1482 family protein [Enterobacter kobei]|uniref:DUF1482 family protein n=1 Tax=Enterobacter kobei TaxID=208224 RepID=UPI0039FD2856
MICSSNTDCIDVIKGVYDTKSECEFIIYQERYFNAECYPSDSFLQMGETEVTSINP